MSIDPQPKKLKPAPKPRDSAAFNDLLSNQLAEIIESDGESVSDSNLSPESRKQVVSRAEQLRMTGRDPPHRNNLAKLILPGPDFEDIDSSPSPVQQTLSFGRLESEQ